VTKVPPLGAALGRHFAFAGAAVRHLRAALGGGRGAVLAARRQYWRHFHRARPQVRVRYTNLRCMGWTEDKLLERAIRRFVSRPDAFHWFPPVSTGIEKDIEPCLKSAKLHTLCHGLLLTWRKK
jgi:hypothetical protein